jgi:UDP-glucose 4-epimerase
VLQVLDAVKRVSGRDFKVAPTGRRAGDPAAIVARADLIRERLGWRPVLDDLDTIVRHAISWEESLERRNFRY